MVAYGTETYTAQGLATETVDILAEKGFAAEVLDLEDFEPPLLQECDVFLVITSTFGDGEPPSNAEYAHDYLMSDGAASVAGLRFSVCALGDTAYELFCQCGKDFDQRLEALGGERIARRVDCDTDFDDTFQGWIDSVSSALSSLAVAPDARRSVDVIASSANVRSASVDDRPSIVLEPQPKPATGAFHASSRPSQKVGTRKNPYLSKVIENRNLNHPFSEKETRHIVLELNGEQVPYKVGDALDLSEKLSRLGETDTRSRTPAARCGCELRRTMVPNSGRSSIQDGYQPDRQANALACRRILSARAHPTAP